MAASCLPRGEIGPATDASVATGRNGSANTDQRLSPRRIDGESGRLHFARAIIDGGNIPHVIGGVGMVMALVTILYGFLMYLPQQDMKRLLAGRPSLNLAGCSSACRSPSSARGWHGGQHRLHRQPRVR